MPKMAQMKVHKSTGKSMMIPLIQIFVEPIAVIDGRPLKKIERQCVGSMLSI